MTKFFLSRFRDGRFVRDRAARQSYHLQMSTPAHARIQTLPALVRLFALLALFPAPTPAQQFTPGLTDARHDTAVQQAHAIGLALFSYATDHDGSMPPGNSSTEVFQNLIAGGYVSDPKIFYLAMPGKVVPVSTTLKPENVSFDVTTGVDSDTSDDLPIVFSTGFKITYAAGGSAAPLAQPAPRGLAVTYKNDSTKYCVPTNPDGTVANFIPTTFDAKGKTYRQLTPDGPLP